MRLLTYRENGELGFTADFINEHTIPPYAILSHMWGADSEEVTFEDVESNTGESKPGYEKIRFCGQQAQQDGLQYFWVDTCCIDKTDKAELSQAIQSMFRWYQNATKCYVYLSDVSTRKRKPDNLLGDLKPSLRASRWFTRGWTLQELLAPKSVEFFSRDWESLEDRRLLKSQISKVTGIPYAVLEGASLSQFSINERLRWKEHRETRYEEDGAYSLLGIFGVNLAPMYGEGSVGAFRRLMDEIHMLERCIQDIYSTDPRNDKKRIEDTKGGLLKDSYSWVLTNQNFRQWQNDPQRQLLSISGDPGKGKTMLLCGIIDELQKSGEKALVSYFFCQATDSRINVASAVLRGLLYMLVTQQPSLVYHVRKKHDFTGKTMFEDVNSWVVLTEIFANLLQDPSLKTTYLIIDALDECVTGLQKLLDFIGTQSSACSQIKWVVSSRNWPDIQEKIARVGQKETLNLELNAESVSTAVRMFIEQKVSHLAHEKRYNDKTRAIVLDHLKNNANDKFLWVALVCQNLKQTPRWNVLKTLDTFPPGLDSLYEQMMKRITKLDVADLCKQILALVEVVYRPITVEELVALVNELQDMDDDYESIQEIISLCGSFLTLREGIIYFVHQSAQDFLLTGAAKELFPNGTEEIHHSIFSRSLEVMSMTLKRDMYGLEMLGYHIEDAKKPDPDPLAGARYSCIYWVDHLRHSDLHSSEKNRTNLQDGGIVDVFMNTRYVYWLEALSLCKSMSKGITSMSELQSLTSRGDNTAALNTLVRDARRYIMYHKRTMEENPLQVYTSALLFSPTNSLVRRRFKKEESDWITIKPGGEETWKTCLQTLEGHRDSIWSVALSGDSTRLASASTDKTIKIWDTSTAECLQTLDNSGIGWSVAFSPNSAWLASADFATVNLWDMNSACVRTLTGHTSWIKSLNFSYNSAQLDQVVKLLV